MDDSVFLFLLLIKDIYQQIEPFKDRKAGKLSGGMKQKLGLACTLVRSPELLLLDEPSIGVDPLSRRDLWTIIERLVQEDNLNVIISTAYMDEAERCDVVLMLRNGKFIAEGSPNEIKGKYQVDSVEEAFIVAGKNLELENKGAAK